jgi:hypothetical protein
MSDGVVARYRGVSLHHPVGVRAGVVDVWRHHSEGAAKRIPGHTTGPDGRRQCGGVGGDRGRPQDEQSEDESGGEQCWRPPTAEDSSDRRESHVEPPNVTPQSPQSQDNRCATPPLALGRPSSVRRVFHVDGRPVSWPYFTREVWHPALVTAGLEPRAPYNLRHSYALHNLQAGVPIATLARQMGHSDVSRTFTVYGGWVREMGADAAAMRGAWILAGGATAALDSAESH